MDHDERGFGIDSRTRHSFFQDNKLDTLEKEFLTFTDFVPEYIRIRNSYRAPSSKAQDYELSMRLRCLANMVTSVAEVPTCANPGCSKLVGYDDSSIFNETCSWQCAAIVTRQKPDDHTRINVAGYVEVLDPLREGKRKRYRMKHLVMLDTVLGRHRRDEDGEIHHLNGVKLDNRYVNFVVCFPSRHRELEDALGQFLESRLALGQAPLSKLEKQKVDRTLMSFVRLSGMWVQPEIYARWRAEGRITNWSPGPKAEWELTRAERRQR